MIEIITGSLLDAKEKYICHQCNCVSTGAAGIAAVIFNQFPYSDCYSSRTSKALHDVPGTIKIMGNGIDERLIINAFGQKYPGGIWEDFLDDNSEMREKYFQQCLEKISEIKDLESIAFNWRIGAGIAGGNWLNIMQYLENFAKIVEEKQNAKVFIYRRACDE